MCERCENVKFMQRLNERFEWSELCAKLVQKFKRTRRTNEAEIED